MSKNMEKSSQKDKTYLLTKALHNFKHIFLVFLMINSSSSRSEGLYINDTAKDADSDVGNRAKATCLRI